MAPRNAYFEGSHFAGGVSCVAFSTGMEHHLEGGGNQENGDAIEWVILVDVQYGIPGQASEKELVDPVADVLWLHGPMFIIVLCDTQVYP